MFDINQPFESKHYQLFSWPVEEISKKIFSTNHHVAACGGFAVVSLEQLAHPELSFITEKQTYWQGTEALKIYKTCGALQRHDLVICQLPERVTEPAAPGTQEHHHAYLREVVLIQLAWIERWTAVLIDHAAQRKVGTSTMLSIPSIRLRLGQVIQHSSWLTQCMALNSWSTQQTLVEIEDMVDALIKTAGGRAMLQQGLVEMSRIFSVLNHIYLGARNDEF